MNSNFIAISGSQNQDFRTIPGLWPDLRGVTVLDLGCGIGLYSAELARCGARVVGVDLSVENLRLARGNTRESQASWVCADGRHLPFKKGIFAMVVCIEVLTHLPPEDRLVAFREIARIACPDALVYMTLHNRERLDLRAWLKRRAAQEVYETTNLHVWPTRVEEALCNARECSLQSCASPRYLNFYSRFSADFIHKYPRVARVLQLAEDILSQLPFARRAAITFLLQLRRLC